MLVLNVSFYTVNLSPTLIEEASQAHSVRRIDLNRTLHLVQAYTHLTPTVHATTLHAKALSSKCLSRRCQQPRQQLSLLQVFIKSDHLNLTRWPSIQAKTATSLVLKRIKMPLFIKLGHRCLPIAEVYRVIHLVAITFIPCIPESLQRGISQVLLAPLQLVDTASVVTFSVRVVQAFLKMMLQLLSPPTVDILVPTLSETVSTTR